MFKWADDALLPLVKGLWGETFKDEPAFIDASLKAYTGRPCVAVQEDALLAQLFMVPCSWKGRKGVYLYALATQPSCRGQGIMSGLMQWAETQAMAGGATFACLIPASAPLFDYYTKRGYTIEWKQRRLHHSLQAADGETTRLTSGEWGHLRRALLCPAPVAFAPTREAFLLAQLEKDGVVAAQNENAFAVYAVQGDCLLVPELGAQSEDSAIKLLGRLAAREGCTTARVTLPAGSALWKDAAPPVRFALAKGLGGNTPPAAAWLRFGFEELE